MFDEQTKCPAERKMMSVTASYPTRNCDLTSPPLAVVCKIHAAAKITSKTEVTEMLSAYFATFRTSLAMLCC